MSGRTRPAWYYRQSAVIPWRRSGAGIEVLLITSRKRKRWVVPKGIHEPGLTAGESAAREAREEAGVAGQVSAAPVGRYEYGKWGGTCRVEVYSLRVTAVHEEWPESFRDREWLKPEEAAARIREADLRRLILRVGRVSEMRDGSPAFGPEDVGRSLDEA